MAIDLEDMLLIAGAIGVGYILAKKRGETKAAVAAVAPTAQTVARIPDEGAELFIGTPVVEYVPYPAYGYPGGAYAPNFNFYGGGGRRHHRRHH